VSIGVWIIGLGAIGMQYDLFAEDGRIQSHARAIDRHPDYRLVGATDVDPKNRSAFEGEYGIAATSDLRHIPHQGIDILVLATPTNTHRSVLEETLTKVRPSIVLCEKPLAWNEQDAAAIVQRCRSVNARLFVNFVRRALPETVQIRSMLREARCAGPVRGLVWYSKGFVHNGSHWIDLLSYWFGDLRSIVRLQAGRTVRSGDAEPIVRVSFDDTDIYMVPWFEETYTLFSAEVATAKGLLSYMDGGATIHWRPISRGQTERDVPSLALDWTPIESNIGRYQWFVFEELRKAIESPSSLVTLTTGDEALKNLTVQLGAVNT
jgi:predicted dehydrogenase